MKRSIAFTALMLLLQYIASGQVQSMYLIDLKDTGRVSHILPRIPGIESTSVDADRMKSTSGIALDQFFYVENKKDYKRARITNFDYSLKRNSTVIGSGHSNSPLWDNVIHDNLKKIEKGDSLFIYNIKAFVKIEDSVIDLVKMPNLIFDTLRLAFTSTVISPTERELSFNRKILKLPGFSKLSELYGSDIAIDRSVHKLGFKHNKANGQYQIRYQFLNDDRVEHDFTFIENRKGILTKVYDNLTKKAYTIKQWENMIQVIR